MLDDKKIYIIIPLTAERGGQGSRQHSIKFGPTELTFLKPKHTDPFSKSYEIAHHSSCLGCATSIKTFKLQTLFKTSKACQEENIKMPVFSNSLYSVRTLIFLFAVII